MKIKKAKTLCIRVTDKQYEKLKKIAEQKGYMSIAELIRQLISSLEE